MLFLPQSVYDARASLWGDLQAGRTTAAQAYQAMVELDPDDYVGLIGLGQLQRDEGDFAAAEEYFWRAIRAHPCMSPAYLELARMLNRQPESAALSEALLVLGVSKRDYDSKALMEGIDYQTASPDGKLLEGFRKLPPAAQVKLIVEAKRAQGNDEPPAVTERLRQLRLIEEMVEDVVLDRELVDKILGEGETIAPLLTGVLRGWAQDLLQSDADSAVENALALLGETGSPAELPYVLEFVDLEDEEVAGTASWALGRICERYRAEAARFLFSIAAGLSMVERIAVAQETLRQPDFDPAGKLLLRLSEDMDSWDSADRDAFFPALLSVMVIARGGAGARMGRAALLKQAGLLSRNVRRECDQMLAEIPSDAVPPPAKGPSPITVYDICAREVIWSEEYEEEELEEDYSPVQEPVRRTAAPGRNDPCWCNSGKKYKKCHLESDERSRQGPREEVRPRPGSNEFAGLRKRLGDFLGEVVPEREMRRALTEFLGPEHEGEEHDSTVLLMDWLLHDWVPPVLGRTVMQEFLVRRGARLTEREREMLQAWSRSFVGFYEVQKLTEGVGITLKDLIFGETFFVHDVSMSTVLAPWDGLLARVVPGERGTELAGVGLTVPRHSIEPLRSWMEEDRAETGLSWREYLKGNWGRVRRQAAEIADRWLQSLQLTNTDGEELLFSKSVYGMTDEAAVVEALRSCPGLQKESGAKQTDENFVWLNQKKTLMANIRIGGGELVLECNSRERVERGKLLLLSVAGDLLRHLRDEFTTQKELKARAAVAPRGVPKRGGEIPKEVRDQVMTRYMEQHYAGWPDIELPALDGKTPREAVRTAKGRAQVIAVLKDFENGEDRKRKAGEPFYDVGRLRTELGLDS